MKFKKKVRKLVAKPHIGCNFDYRTMSILQHFETILRIFYIIGVAPSRLSAEDRIHKSCLHNAPVLVSFLSSICVALFQFLSYYLESFGLISKLINYSFYACILFSNVTANWQCWHCDSMYQNLIFRIQQLEQFCNSKFSRKVSYKSIKRRYTVNSILIIGCFTISAAIVLGQAWYIATNSTEAIILAAVTTFKELMCALTVLHFTLYAEIVRLFIAELNSQILFSPICFYLSTKVAFLKDIKSMYMDVFLLMKQVNNFFGWHLLALMIHYVILITYSLYWIFLTIQIEGKFYSVAEATFTLLYCILTVIVLVNSCEYCSSETLHLMENIERYDFYASDNVRLRELKNEVFEQIRKFPMDVTAKGYFTLSRRLLTAITSNCFTYIIILIQFFLSSDRVTVRNN